LVVSGLNVKANHGKVKMHKSIKQLFSQVMGK